MHDIRALMSTWGAIFAMVSVAGCGADTASPGAGGTTSTRTGGDDATIPRACPTQPSELSLSGTWAAYGELAINLGSVPGGAVTICPPGQVGAASLLILIDATEDPADPQKLSEMRVSLCSIQLPTLTALAGTCDPASSGLLATQLVAPKSFTDALPKVVTSPATGSVSGRAAGASVTFGPVDITVGAQSGVDLPKWNTTSNACSVPGVGDTNECEASCVSDCDALRDDDADGFPGVTVHVCGKTPDDATMGLPCNAEEPNVPGIMLQGRAFMDIEVTPAFSGTAKSSCEVAGNMTTDVFYNFIGGEIYLAGGLLPLTAAIKSMPTFQVDPAASKFRMVRIDGRYGALSLGVDPEQPSAACATLLAHVNEL